MCNQGGTTRAQSQPFSANMGTTQSVSPSIAAPTIDAGTGPGAPAPTPNPVTPTPPVNTTSTMNPLAILQMLLSSSGAPGRMVG